VDGARCDESRAPAPTAGHRFGRERAVRQSARNERATPSALHIGESGYRCGFEKPWGTLWTTTNPYPNR
jgi:hypothetical protein